MASCSTTPFDGLGKRVNADRSHHRDAFAPQNAQQGLRQSNNVAANAQFAQFARGNQAGADFSNAPSVYDFASPNFQQAPGHANAGWANQFSAEKSRFAAPEQFNAMFSQSVRDPVQHQPPANATLQHDSGYYVPVEQLKPITPMLQPLRAPPMAHASSMLHSQQTMATVQAPVVDNSAFDQAFAAAEAQIKSLELTEEPQTNPAPPTQKDQENLRDVAASVLETVASSSANDPTVDKMKNSKFMALMNGLKNEKVKLAEDNENFVTTTGTPVSFQDMDDGVPDVLRPRDGESGQQYVDRVYEQLHHQEGFAVHRAPRGQAPLEDPFDYIDRIKKSTPMMNVNDGSQAAYTIPTEEESSNDQAAADDKPPLLTPFEAANLYGPGGLSMADWEEHYDDAVWVPSEQ